MLREKLGEFQADLGGHLTGSLVVLLESGHAHPDRLRDFGEREAPGLIKSPALEVWSSGHPRPRGFIL